MPRPRLPPLVVAAALASCDTNGSNPTATSPLVDLYANDPALSYDLVHDAVVLAYDDEAGAFGADTDTGKLLPLAAPSRAGISTSADHGKTWTRVGPIPPVGAGCGDARCAVAVGAGGALAPFESAGSVVYVGLGYTDPTLAAPDALVSSLSTDSGATWSPARIAGWTPGRPPGPPSLARLGHGSVVAYTDTAQGELFLLLAASEPPAFEPPYAVPIDNDDVGVAKANPVLRLASSTLGYVAYMLPRDDQGSTFDLRVALLFRTLTPEGYTPWQGVLAFALDGVTIDATRPGALGRTWRDDAPIDLSLGMGPHVYLTYRQLSSRTGSSEVFLVDCDASFAPNCDVEADGTNSLGWNVHALDDIAASTPFTGGKYRPRVSADPYSDALAVSWMQETAPGSAQVTLGGMSSIDQLTFGPEVDLRAGGNGGPWTPCPTASLVDATNHSYGSHDALVLLPYIGGQDAEPVAVGAHVDSSGGCDELGELTFDQHVAASAW